MAEAERVEVLEEEGELFPLIQSYSIFLDLNFFQTIFLTFPHVQRSLTTNWWLKVDLFGFQINILLV